ncbi:MAG: NAD(P)/FAD-dependent oxidoreductase [Solirubrobacteraceae bacterium]
MVVIGSGFGGLFAARRLRRAPVSLTVIDRAAYHLFQPLLYQVATGILSEGEIAPPIRDVLRRQRNARVVLGDVTGIDFAAREVTSHVLGRELVTPYDSLIVAAGAVVSYYGHDEYRDVAPGLKTIEDARELRNRIFGAFEMAEIEPDPDTRTAWLTFVVVGGGATGIEMAGQIAELAHRTLRSNFRTIDPGAARIVLVDGAPRILMSFRAGLAAQAARRLSALGVEIHVGAKVTDVDADGITMDGPGPEPRRVRAMTKVWAAGVQGAPLGRLLAAASDVPLEPGGRVRVLPDCSLPGHPEVFVVGDLMALGHLPGVAEVAMQSGRHAAGEIVRRLSGHGEPRPFHYHDLGNLASISRYYAVAELGPVGVAGLAGWLLWLVVHLTFLTGFKNRISALFHWVISFCGRARAERTITIDESERSVRRPPRP